MTADDLGECLDVHTLDIGDQRFRPDGFDVGDMGRVADHPRHLIASLDEQGSEQEGDAAVAAEHEDA